VTAPLQRLRRAAAGFKRNVRVLFYACRDPELPLLAKLLLGFTLARALSPIELILLLWLCMLLPGVFWILKRDGS
jgi:uncharacterized membrane protein YkvA (DUF1232 family)